MNRAVLPLLAIALIALVAASGCILPEVDAVEKVRESPSVAAFLAEHPNAQLSFAALGRQQVLQRSAELEAKCGPGLGATDYYYVLFSEGVNTVEVLVGQQTKAIACIHRSDDLCTYDAGCDDRVQCTTDVCMGIPKKCVRSKITGCFSGDGCCPEECGYEQDADCPAPECETDADCDDLDASTGDACVRGKPNKCSHSAIVECVSADGYCPEGCHQGNDTDCDISECEADADCDDLDASTRDECTGSPAVCSHAKVTECIAGDGYCPSGCDYSSDEDCLAELGSLERITVKCGENEAELNAILTRATNGELKADFHHFVTHANNPTLQSYTNRDVRSYKYNDVETSETEMSERISITATAVFDKPSNKSKLYIRENRLSYTVNIGEGVPATDSATSEFPFVASDYDKVIIPFFGEEALVALVDKTEGEVNLVSDQSWLDADSGRTLRGLGGEGYTIGVSGCDADSASFVLKKDGVRVTNQEAGTGSLLFEDELSKAIRINYYNPSTEDDAIATCEYRYSIGSHLEKIYHGKEFPLGTDSDWKASLEFSGKKLQTIKISNNSDKWFDQPLLEEETIEILGESGTFGENFCTLTFKGMVR